LEVAGEHGLLCVLSAGDLRFCVVIYWSNFLYTDTILEGFLEGNQPAFWRDLHGGAPAPASGDEPERLQRGQV
jgi:hypothetical protein